MDRINVSVVSPFRTLALATSPASTREAAAPGDGYAGSVDATARMQALAQPDATSGAAPAHRARALTFAALAFVGVLGGAVAAHAEAVAAPPDTSVSQTSTQQATFTYSNPARPLPDNSDADASTWMKNATKAFDDVKRGDATAFLQDASSDGVWVRGLPEAPETSTGMVYMTPQELAKDLQQKGPFYQHVFAQHDNARFVITPDAQGQVQTILLD